MSEILPVYVALVELRPLKGCQHDPDDVAGAFSRCYIPARSHPAAIEYLQRVLAEDHFELVNIEWCYRDDEVEWENPDSEETTTIITEAQKTGEFIYRTMDYWGHDAPDV